MTNEQIERGLRAVLDEGLGMTHEPGFKFVDLPRLVEIFKKAVADE